MHPSIAPRGVTLTWRGAFFPPRSPVNHLCMVLCTYDCFCKQNCSFFPFFFSSKMSEKHPSSSSSSAPPMPVVYCAVDNITMCCVGLFGPAAIRLFLPGSIGSPVICPPQSYKSNTRTTTKCCAQHEIVKAPGDTGQFQGWVWCFTASLWWLWRFYSILLS